MTKLKYVSEISVDYLNIEFATKVLFDEYCANPILFNNILNNEVDIFVEVNKQSIQEFINKLGF